jgi:hypothetical protein
MMLDPFEQAVGLIEPGVAGATMKVPLLRAKSLLKTKVRCLKPIAGSA